MLIDFPFLPETQETVDQWHVNLKESKMPAHEIEEMNLSVNYNIPENLTKEHSGLDDNTGIYYPKLLHSYQEVKLPDGLEIDSYFSFLPVILTEKKIDHDDYCEPVELSEGNYSDDVDIYKIQSEIFMSTYGFVLSIADFMELIGEQLKVSKRKFCVAFYWVDYHQDVFHKSGRLYNKDHSKVKLNKDDKLISFHIFELLDENDTKLKSGAGLPFMGHVMNLPDINDAVKAIDQIHDKTFIESLNLREY
jgi:hypothetical protein